MATLSLQPLLEGAGLDVLFSHALPLLGLHDLGRLASTSRRLRAVVADVPESTWQACAWRSQPHPQHPIHSAASCRAYLCRQHAAHAAISSGRSGVVPTPPAYEAILAPDLTRHAVLRNRQSVSGSHSLQLLDATTHSETACYKLPLRESWGLPHWDQASSRVALPWGSNWYTDDDEGLPVPTGVCIVELRTGGLTHIDLGLQSTCSILGGVTAAGSTVVRHMRNSITAWSVFDISGTELHSTPSCFGATDMIDFIAERLILAPAGTHAASYPRASCAGCTQFAIWELAAGQARSVNTGSHLREVLFSPCSRHALTMSVGRAQIWDTEGSLLSSTQLDAQPFYASWAGDVVAVVCRLDAASESATGSYARGPGCLQVYSLRDAGHGLSLQSRVPEGSLAAPGWRLGSLCVSPDWQHIAVLASRTAEHRASISGRSELLVLDANTQLCMRAGLPKDHYGLTWSAGGDAVACDMLCSEVVRFG